MGHSHIGQPGGKVVHGFCAVQENEKFAFHVLQIQSIAIKIWSQMICGLDKAHEINKILATTAKENQQKLENMAFVERH